MIHIEHYHDHACEHAACCPILAAISDLKGTIMQSLDDIKREVGETKAQNAQIIAAITGLLGVVQPLIEANAAAKVALEAAQAALAASAADTAAIEAELATAASELDATQAAVQPAVEAALAALPPAPPVP
ncbi:MAG: hypothetical protein RJA55_2320 [Acidobacteriota bacterium]|jgi:multidrug resistance efflux pump